jgi:hypothetical protein
MGVLVVNGLNCVAMNEPEDINDETGTFKLRYKPDFIPTNNSYFETRCEKALFDSQRNGEVWKDNPEEDRPDDIVRLDFGYALTVHKSQGSEWNNVLIINDYGGNPNDYPNWLYTGITRGKKSITLTNA